MWFLEGVVFRTQHHFSDSYNYTEIYVPDNYNDIIITSSHGHTYICTICTIYTYTYLMQNLLGWLLR